jgi:hypothetical protein
MANFGGPAIYISNIIPNDSNIYKVAWYLVNDIHKYIRERLPIAVAHFKLAYLDIPIEKQDQNRPLYGFFSLIRGQTIHHHELAEYMDREFYFNGHKIRAKISKQSTMYLPNKPPLWLWHCDHSPYVSFPIYTYEEMVQATQYAFDKAYEKALNDDEPTLQTINNNTVVADVVAKPSGCFIL